MEKAMKALCISGARVVALVAALGLAGSIPLGARDTTQQTFPSPEDAANAFFSAVTSSDMDAMRRLLGPEADALLSSGDPGADQRARAAFIENYQEMHRFVTGPDGVATLTIGAENWPFPIPLAQKDGAWFFDTEKGKQEILVRRVGKNERATIGTMIALTDAQKEYAGRLRWTANAPEYAQKFLSDDGQQNGLYWKTSGGQPQSPLGPLIAEAAREGSANTSAQPFRGYVYRMLSRQGKSAPGGAMNYVRNGRMTRGFAFVAYPAAYKSSGVMTFIAGKDGKVYEKDLGSDTARIAASMTTFNPDKTWRVVASPIEGPASHAATTHAHRASE
jgi:hypothetical protein